MKKYFIILASVLVAAVACNKNTDNTTPAAGDAPVVSLSGDNAFVDGKATIKVTLDKAHSTKAVRVSLALDPSSTLTSGNVTIPEGITVKKGVTSATAEVTFVRGALDAGTYTAVIKATEATNGATIGTASTITITATVEEGSEKGPVLSLSADNAFANKSAAITATLDKAAEEICEVSLEVAADSQVAADLITLPALAIPAGQTSVSGNVTVSIKGLAAGTYAAKINAVSATGGVAVGTAKAVTITLTVSEDEVVPSIPTETRNGKVYKADPVCSENYLFEKEEYADLGLGSTFQVKFWANSWKENGKPDRLCTFETRDENPAMLVRFSCDGTQPGQLRFNNNAWQIGGPGDTGVKLTDENGNAYVFEAQKWHVLTMVLTPGENNAVYVDFYDNDVYINRAEGKATNDKFYLQRFEFGMSWEEGSYDNSSYPRIQLFNGYIDYARVWTRALSHSEIVKGLCDLKDNQKEGLLAYWIMNDGAGDGILENRAGDSAYDINWSKMSEMNGGDFRKNLDLKANFLENLVDMDPANLCQF